MPIKRMSEGPPMGAESPEHEQGMEAESSDDNTATLDASILGGQEVSPGDRIELEVVSVDPEMGSLTVKYPEDKGAKPEGIESMASEYDKPQSEA